MKAEQFDAGIDLTEALDLFKARWVKAKDPIIAELHETRERLYAQYNGDLRAYSKAAIANALALGFKFYSPTN